VFFYHYLHWEDIFPQFENMVYYSPGRTTTYPSEVVEEGIRYHFLGGGNEVGNVGCIIEDKTQSRLLIDYGLAPTDPPRYPQESPFVSDAIITHSHVDHLGMVPWLHASHQTNLHATSLTSSISEIMWRDCYKISRIEGYPLAWDKRDLEEAMYAWKTQKFNNWNEHESWKWKLHRAGHIPGASMVEIETPSHKILHTGDFDTRDSQLVKGAKPISADILFVEGTYGGRNHVDKKEEEKRLIQKTLEIVDKGGTVIIPSFAQGRGQDVLMTLYKSGLDFEIHYDGMGKRLTQIMLDHSEFLKDPQTLKEAFASAHKVSSKSDKKKALEGDVIITTSGMLDGGPSLWYLNRLRHDSKNAVFLVGYQAEGSGGHHLLNEGRVPIYGNMAKITNQIERFDLSTHAGHDEIVTFVKNCNPEHAIIFHTDPTEARPPLEKALTDLNIEVHSPENGKSYNIY